MIKGNYAGIMTIMGFIVAFLFLAFGIYILFSPKMINIPKEFRTIFGVVVIMYGLFRSVIIYQKSKNRRESDEESEY
jgi:amino acid permease